MTDNNRPQRNDLLDYARKVFVTVVIIIAVLVIPYVLYKIFPHFVPFILAYLTALLLEPLNLWLGRRLKFNRPLAVTVSCLLFLGIIAFLGYFIVNRIYIEALGLFAFLQSHAPDIQTWFLDLIRQFQTTIGLLPAETAAQINQSIIKFINDLANINIVSRIGAYTYSLSTAIPNFFFQILIYFLSVYLFSYQLDSVHRRFYGYFKESSKKKVVVVLGDLRKATFGFLKAQVILSTITFVLSFIGLTILKVKYAVAIAFLIVIVDILPILGVGSVLLPWAVVSLIQGKLFFAISLAVLFIVIVVIRKSIEPKILGERIGLSALATLISIWVGFKVMGILGIFLFPLACIFYKALVKVGIIRINFKI